MQIDNSEFRNILLSYSLNHEDFTREVSPYIQPEYFEEKIEKIIWTYTKQYLQKYHKLPTPSILKVGLESNRNLTQGELDTGKQLIENLTNSDHADVSYDWIKENAEKWCQTRAAVLAVISCMNIIDGKDKKNSIESCPSILTEAVGINFDHKIGTDYIPSASDRYDLYGQKLDTIATGLNHLDEIMDGGYPKKSLSVFLAGTGVGKSLTMCHSAASALKDGHNALYITLEMAEEKIAERIDQNLMSMTKKQIEDTTKESYLGRFEKFIEKDYGRLIIKEYGTGSASIIHFNALLQELEQKEAYTPDIIFVDYINICASSRAAKGANSYEKVKEIAAELRCIALENNVPVVTATQSNREGIGQSDLDLTNTSESIGLPQTADFMAGLSSTDAMRDAGQMKVIQLKNRYADPAYKRVHIIGVDYSQMRLFDLDTQPQHIQMMNGEDEDDGTPVFDNTDSARGLFSENKLTDVDWG